MKFSLENEGIFIEKLKNSSKSCANIIWPYGSTNDASHIFCPKLIQDGRVLGSYFCLKLQQWTMNHGLTYCAKKVYEKFLLALEKSLTALWCVILLLLAQNEVVRSFIHPLTYSSIRNFRAGFMTLWNLEREIK